MGQLRHDKEFPHTRSCHSVLLLLTSCINMACLLLSSCSVVADSATPWAAARQVPLSFTICWSLLKLMSIESVMPSSHLILCGLLRLLSSIFSSVRIQCVRANSMCHIGLFATLGPPGSSVHGLLQARMLEWVAISFSRGSSHPGVELRFPAL